MKTKRTALDQIEFMRNLLAFLLVGAFISVVPVFTFVVIPKANEQILTYMIGQLSGMATLALGFYFVNKVGQDALDATRAENTGKMAEAVTAAIKTAEPNVAVGEAVQDTADAAQTKADEIKEQGQ